MSDPFRRPLGLVLSGGGALGSWQAAALAGLERSGVRFDSVLGFSAGALTGAYYFLGRIQDTLRRWREPAARGLRLRPRLFPPSLFSNDVMRDALALAADEEAAQRAARCRLVVVAAPRRGDEAVYSIYTPDGADGWDAPLLDHLLASCAIPLIFPPVKLVHRGREMTLVDGGVPCLKPMRFDELGPCRDVVVLDVVRPDETARTALSPGAMIDHAARRTMRLLMGQGLASLRERPDRPRVYRLAPSRRLEYTMLDFGDQARIEASLDLGQEDAVSFLADPAAFEARP